MMAATDHVATVSRSGFANRPILLVSVEFFPEWDSNVLLAIHYSPSTTMTVRALPN